VKTHSRQVLLGVVAGAAASIAAIIAAAAFGGTSQTAVSAPGQPDVTTHFSVLSDQAVPAAPASVVAQFEEIHPGISSARQVRSNASVASYDGAVCAVFEPGSGGCTAQLDHGVWLMGDMIRAYDSEQAPFNLNLYGVAEDGISLISISLADGSIRAIPVVHNVFWATLTNTTFNQIEGITVTSVSGQVSLDPANYFPVEAALASP